MATETQETSPRGSRPWRARADYTAAKTRRQRQEQYRQQTTVLLSVVVVTVVAAVVFVVANWQNGGTAKSVSCAAYPEYCVPLEGGAADEPALEAASSRTLDGESTAAKGVVRYVDQNNIVTMGNPDAPAHFVVVSDYACPHCQDYHETEIPRFIDDYVRTGQATFGFVLVTGTGRTYSDLASQAALCAGEQGAYWEYSDELFRLAQSMGIDQAFSVAQLRRSAEEMGLDGQQLTECLTSNRYAQFMTDYRIFASDHGVTGTPTVLMSYGDSNTWQAVGRDYAALAQLTESANAQ